MLKWTLIPLGLMTAIILAAPQLVILGLILLIVPGLILIAIPTVFAYLATMCLIRSGLRVRSWSWALFAALVLTFALSGAAMYPLRARAIQEWERESLPDIVPPAKLTIANDVVVHWPQRDVRAGGDVVCDYLCTAMLDIPGVTSVTRVTAAGAATFRRGANHPGTLVMPHRPHELLETFAKLGQEKRLQKFDGALQAEWALRIAQGDELKRDQPINLDDADWTIALENRHEKGRPQFDRLEIRDRQGTVMVRRSLVRHFVPFPLFFFGFEGGSSANGFGGARFTVGGSEVSNQPRFHQFDGAVELLRTVDISRPTPALGIVERMEKTLLEVLDNPNATEAQLLIAPMWLSQFHYNAKAAQIDTIARILADGRIADPSELLRTALWSGTDLTPLRAGLVQRYRSAADSKTRTWYIASLVRLANGTFAEPTDAERAIWNDATKSGEAAPFLERMADQGESAVPKLMALLEESLVKPWHERRRVLEGIREALKRLGPKAESAVPRVLSLMEKSPKSLLNTRDDRIEWLVALRVIGVEAQDLPHGSDRSRPGGAASEIKGIEQRVQRYLEHRNGRR